MAEEYCGGANWWDSSPNTNGPSASSVTTLANSGGGGGVAMRYGWLNETSTTYTKLDASSLQLMGLGLSNNSPSLEWNQQHMLRNPEKVENSFRSNMVQEGGVGLNSNFQQETGGGVICSSNSQPQWRSGKLFPNNEDALEFKQISGRGFSLDQPQFSPSCSSIESSITCNNQGFQLDSSLSSSVFCSPSSISQGLIGHTDQQQHVTNYGGDNSNNPDNFEHQHNYFGMPQFLKTTLAKQQLQFMNDAPCWNPSGPGASMNDVRPNFVSSLQAPPQLSLPTFEEKPKPKTSTMELRDTNSMAKKTSSTTNQETNTKRPRNDGASSTLPPFMVRKEKMGDRITALQQLVSPFGKTDTASVLSEAIEYIKFLHEQVSVLSNPYLKSGAPYQQQQSGNEKGKIDRDGPKQDLRSRGLCLVPVSSTFPVAHETTVDFWTPTFGGTFR